MAKKPTWTTGHINFGKDGSVTKHTQRLPDDKEGQEAAVTALFLEKLDTLTGRRFHARQLEENNNDFDLEPLDGGAGVKLELTELAFAQWGRLLTKEEWIEGQTGFREFVMPAPDTYYGVDTAARDAALAELLRKKRNKNYDKPSDRPFWLLIWTVAPDVGHTLSEDGKVRPSAALRNLLRELFESGAGVFDAIWLAEYPHILTPVWPEPPTFAPEDSMVETGDSSSRQSRISIRIHPVAFRSS